MQSNLRQYGACVGFLLLPALMLIVFSRSGSNVEPYINASFLLATAAAAWRCGTIAGLVSCFAAVLFFIGSVHQGWAMGPAHVGLARPIVLLAFTVLIGQIGAARRRTETVLRSANNLLEERVRLRTEELERARRQLEESNEELKYFSYTVSHDLQQPLRSISLNAQLLERHHAGQLTAEAAALAHDLARSALKLNLLVRDLLNYTRASGDELRESGIADFSTVLDTVLFNLADVIKETNAQIWCHQAPRPRVHEAHLQQILQNLISNSLKYRGHSDPAISINAHLQNQEWLISVSDNGIGLDAVHKDEIFVPFKRVHDPSRQAGTGLGLALVKRIVERYGGKIWVESEAGGGATFTFTLPAENQPFESLG